VWGAPHPTQLNIAISSNLQSFLVHSWEDPEVWQIITIWNNGDMLRQMGGQMGGSGQTPRGILMFREAKSEPTHGVFEIAQQWTIEAK